MTETSSAKLNMAAERGYSYYGSIPRELCSVPGMTVSAAILGGFLSSFSGMTDACGNVKRFNGKRDEIIKYIGGSPATVSRSMTKLKNSDFVERKGMSSYEFKQDKLGSDKKWHFPLEITTRIFEFKGDDGDVIARRTLTPSERLTYAYFYTKLSNVTHKTTTEAVYSEIAKELSIDPTTVSSAVKALCSAGLLYCPKSWQSVNGRRKGRVALRKGWEWFRKETKYRERKKTKPGTKAPQGQTEAMNREKYYEELQASARQKAVEALDAARSYEQFRKSDDERMVAYNLYRRALFSGNNGYAQELSDKIDKLDKKCRNALLSVGIDPDSLLPGHYVKCKRCGDTGWKKDGKACDCFSQGAPPGKAEGEGVGEQNT